MLSGLTDSLRKYLSNSSDNGLKRPRTCDPKETFSPNGAKKQKLCKEFAEKQEESLEAPVINFFQWLTGIPSHNYFLKEFIRTVKYPFNRSSSYPLLQDSVRNTSSVMSSKWTTLTATRNEWAEKQLTRAPLHGRKCIQAETTPFFLSSEQSGSSQINGWRDVSCDNSRKMNYWLSLKNNSSPISYKNALDNNLSGNIRQEQLTFGNSELMSQISTCNDTHLTNGSTDDATWQSEQYHKRLKYTPYANERRRIFAAKESIQLHEKEQYKLLLQQYTSESLFNYPSRRLPTKKDAQVQSDFMTSYQKAKQQTPFKFKTPVRKEKLDKSATCDLIHLIKSNSVRSVSRSKELHHLSDLESLPSSSNNLGPSKQSRALNSSPSTSDDDDNPVITKVKILPKRELSIRSKKDSPFFSPKWLEDLRHTLVFQEEENLKTIKQQEEHAKLLREKREARYATAEEELKGNLQIKGVPVLEEKELESDEDHSAAFPELSSDMEAEVDEALRLTPPDEILAEGFRLSVARRDMETLSGLNWLNDEIINFYMNLLMERSKLDNYPTTYAFNTFFYTKLLNGGHSALKRWTRKMDIFSYDMLLIPVHMGMHWCLAVIDFRHKKIQYYDSMGGQNAECLNALRTYLQDECLDKKKEEFDMGGWVLETVKNIPHQMNGSDCGMFALKYAEYITRDARINFTQADMPYFRRRMVYEIMKKKLL